MTQTLIFISVAFRIRTEIAKKKGDWVHTSKCVQKKDGKLGQVEWDFQSYLPSYYKKSYSPCESGK